MNWTVLSYDEAAMHRTGEKMTQAFRDSLSHLLAEMERIDLLIRYQIAHRSKLQTEDEQFRGLYISDQEVESLLRKPIGMPQWLVSQTEIQTDAAARLEQIENRISERKQQSVQEGVELRLDRLSKIFELGRFDIDVLLVCMAVELDLRYEKLYGYLQDDVTKKK